jgi:hypothetical protein
MKVDAATCGKIRVVDPSTGTLEIEVQRGFSEHFIESFRVVDVTDEIASARALRLRHRVNVPDVAKDPHLERYHVIAKQEGFKAMQATPIFGVDGDIVGTLSTHFPRVHHPSTVAALVLDHCASKAGALIEALLRPE